MQAAKIVSFIGMFSAAALRVHFLTFSQTWRDMNDISKQHYMA
jgi:hypothetical protein